MDLLANSVSVETVFIDPEWIAREEEDVDLIAEGLSDILGVDADFVREQAADTEMLYKVIKRKIPEALADEVRQFVLDNHLGGVHLEADALGRGKLVFMVDALAGNAPQEAALAKAEPHEPLALGLKVDSLGRLRTGKQSCRQDERHHLLHL